MGKWGLVYSIYVFLKRKISLLSECIYTEKDITHNRCDFRLTCALSRCEPSLCVARYADNLIRNTVQVFGGVAEDSSVMGFDTVSLGEHLLTFGLKDHTALCFRVPAVKEDCLTLTM